MTFYPNGSPSSSGGGSGDVKIGGTPAAYEFAQWTSNQTIQGRNYTETRSDLSLVAGTDFYAKTGTDAWRNGVNQTEMGYLDGITGDIQTQFAGKVGLTTQQTISNKTYTSPVLNGTISGSGFLDEDNMVSDSAIKLCSQQSIKKYVDDNIGAGDVTGPGASTDNAIARFNGAGGKTLQNSNILLTDAGNLSSPAGSSAGIRSSGNITMQLGDSSGLYKHKVVNGNGTTQSWINSLGSFYIREQSAGFTDVKEFGQFWANLDGSPFYTNDNGTDYQLNLGGVSNPLSADLNANGSSIYNYINTHNDHVGTNYLFVDGDTGKVVTFNNAGATNATLPNTLPKGWAVTILQLGDGRITFTGTGGMTLRNRQSHTKLNGTYAMGTLEVYAANNVVLGGDTV